MTTEELRRRVSHSLRYHIYVGMLRDLINGDDEELAHEANHLAGVIQIALDGVGYDLGDES